MAAYSNDEIAEQVAQARNAGWVELQLNGYQAQDDLRKLLGEPDVEQLRVLVLMGDQLSTLPPEIGRLTALRQLILSANQLSTLPRELGQLTALTELWLNGNQLSTLPPELGQLTALTQLYLHNNQLSTLPPELGQLTALTTLWLYDNQLPTLPPELGQLTALTMLLLDNNQLSTLPPEFGQLTALTTLDLGNNQLSTLPPELGQLTALTELNLANNQLSTLPPELGQLTALTELNLANNQLSTLPPELGQLTSLTELNLGANQLSTLPPELGQLTALKVLHLAENQLSVLPPGILQLTALTTLGLSFNKFSTLPPELCQLATLKRLFLRNNWLPSLPPEMGRLTALIELDLGFNRLQILPPEIGHLTALRRLDLGHNQLSSVPGELGRLTPLRELDLSDNQLSTLPPEMGHLIALSELFLHGNDRLGIPPEILGPTRQTVSQRKAPPAQPADILAYYLRTRAASDRRPLNEVKVILVGQGSVGKTSLVNRIVYDTFNLGEQKTDGINIEKSWNVPSRTKGEKVQVNFWDFGGQEIMHATHQFFLTKRTVYLLVLDARKGENESNIHYWLKIIRSYGGDSPILVVTNKCEQHHLELNETRLQTDYPSIRGFLTTSCATPSGIEALKTAITEQIHEMPHVFDPLPKEYFEIKRELERRAADENYIDIRDYYGLCNKHGVAKRQEQDAVLRFLHDLGSVLSFNDPENPYSLREMSVLNPEWVTEGVYKILNYKPLAARGGLLEKADLPRTLDGADHPPACHHFILDMMHKFELCFTIAKDAKWLVAELLRVNEIPVDWDISNALNFQYHYDVLPVGIICRFIVRRYEDLTDPPIYWRSGVVLQHEGCKALVRSDGDHGRMYISVFGPEKGRRSMLAVIRDEFADIHRTIPNLPVKQMVPLPDNPEVTVEYDHLLTLEAMRATEFVPQGARRTYNVTELLDGIEDIWMRYMLKLHPPHFVIEPQTSFPDAWEVFCCRILNLHYNTIEIRQRKPPEGGIDLYWPTKQTAYQCKSVEDNTGKFSLSKAEESLRDALESRAETPWKKYVICSNVPLTGDQEKKLTKICKDIEFLTPDFWEPQIRKHWNHVKDRFRPIPRNPGLTGHMPEP